MLCFLYKRSISRSMDTGELPGRLARWHVRRCPACREFQSQCRTLARELPDDARRIAVNVSADLHAKILQRCERVPRAAVEPAVVGQTRSAPHSASARGRILAERARRLLLRPRTAWAAAAAAAVVLAALLGWYFTRKSQPVRSPGAPPEIVKEERPTPVAPPPLAVPDLPTPSGSLAAIDQAVGRRVEEQLRLLREDGKAAADFFLACVPFEIALRER